MNKREKRINNLKEIFKWFDFDNHKNRKGMETRLGRLSFETTEIIKRNIDDFKGITPEMALAKLKKFKVKRTLNGIKLNKVNLGTHGDDVMNTYIKYILKRQNSLE